MIMTDRFMSGWARGGVMTRGGAHNVDCWHCQLALRRTIAGYVRLARVLVLGAVPGGGEIERDDFAAWHEAHKAQLGTWLAVRGVLHCDLDRDEADAATEMPS